MTPQVLSPSKDVDMASQMPVFFPIPLVDTFINRELCIAVPKHDYRKLQWTPSPVLPKNESWHESINLLAVSDLAEYNYIKSQTVNNSKWFLHGTLIIMEVIFISFT